MPIGVVYGLAFVVSLVLAVFFNGRRAWLFAIGLAAVVLLYVFRGDSGGEDSAGFAALILGLVYAAWCVGIVVGSTVRSSRSTTQIRKK